MAGQWITAVGLIAVFLYIADCEVCYRRYVPAKNGCKRPLKQRFENGEECCRHSGAAGYSTKKNRSERIFECTPCMPISVRTGTRERPEVERIVESAVKRTHLEASPPIVDDVTSQHPILIDVTTEKPTTMETSVSTGVSERRNGGWTEWSVWSQCSKTCMAGIQERIRLCPDGGCEGPHKELKPCSALAYCPVDGNYGPWHPWETCSKTCAGGFQTRIRQCNNPPPLNGGANCTENNSETQECGDKKCPVNGQWAGWSSFSDCSVTCGKGIKVRMRECTNPPPSYGGQWCKGKSIQQKKCHQRMCPIQGGWSLWSAWSHPTISCGEAVSVRRRMCDSPRPQFGGKACEGDTIQFKSYVHKYDCPVDGGWTEWTSFGTCGALPCQRGFQLRSRSCTNPKPKNGGRYCTGRPLEKQECTNHEQCHKVDGAWCDWTSWGPCSLTCGTREDLSYRKRIRECACPAPKNGGHDCKDERFQTEDCVKSACPISPPIELDMPVLVNQATKSDLGRRRPDGTSSVYVKPEAEVGSGIELSTNGGQGQKTGCGLNGSGDSDGSEVTCDQEAEEDDIE